MFTLISSCLTSVFPSEQVEGGKESMPNPQHIPPLKKDVKVQTAMRSCLTYNSLKKQLPCKMKSRVVMTEFAGYIFWQLFLRRQ